MPCTTRRVAGRAAQHIWISDEVLSEAFTRFLRASRTNRRYGSSVPGPLEARKRLARRRMGMESVAHHNTPPPSYGFGSWFGLGAARAAPDFERGVRWQAPSPVPRNRRHPDSAEVEEPAIWHKKKKVQSFFGLPSNEETEGARDRAASNVVPYVPLDRRKGEHTAHNESVVNNQKVDEISASTSLPPVTEVEPLMQHAIEIDSYPFSTKVRANLEPDSSRGAFEVLLTGFERDGVHPTDDLRRMLFFFRTPANNPLARSMLRLVEYLGAMQQSHKEYPWKKMWLMVFNYIRALGSVGRIESDEVALILMHTLTQSDMEKYRPDLFSLPHQLQAAYAKVVEMTLQKCHDRDEAIARISVLLDLVQVPVQIEDLPNPAWHSLYSVLAQHFYPSDFPGHFSSMHRSSFAWALIQHWMPRYAAQALPIDPLEVTPNARDTNLDKSTVSDANCLSSKPLDPAVRQEIERTHKLESSVSRQFGAGRYTLNRLIGIISRREDFNLERLIADVFVIYNANSTDAAMKCLIIDALEQVGQHDPLLRLAERLIQDFLAADQPNQTGLALEIFEAMPDATLVNFPTLPLQLVQHGVGSAFGVFNILDRSAKQRLCPRHCSIVHETAYAWACSKHITPRQAFRHVWECYRLLQFRGAPLSAQLSRAMVLAGITRPLAENHRLNRTQVKYVIDIVRKIEGEEEAGRLDKLVFEHWMHTKETYGYTPGRTISPRLDSKTSSPDVATPQGPSLPRIRKIRYNRPQSESTNSLYTMLMPSRKGEKLSSAIQRSNGPQPISFPSPDLLASRTPHLPSYKPFSMSDGIPSTDKDKPAEVLDGVGKALRHRIVHRIPQ